MTREIALHCMKSASDLERELCEECPIYGQMGCDHCFEDALQYVIGMLEQEPRWIPVTERLPEVEGATRCLVTVDIYGIADYTAIRRYFPDTKDFDDTVTAWMPLLEPYKGEANE